MKGTYNLERLGSALLQVRPPLPQGAFVQLTPILKYGLFLGFMMRLILDGRRGVRSVPELKTGGC